MKPIVITAMDVVKGTPPRRTVALLTLACWFVMGAFIAATVTQYVGNVPHSVAAIGGGTIATCIAACLKAA